MSKNRNSSDIQYDLDKIIYDFKSNRTFLVMSVLSEIVLLFLYYLFVISNGNTFDHIVSVMVLLFFAVMSFVQLFKAKTKLAKTRILQKEYNRSIETPQQTLARKRTEKFNRVLEKKEEVLS